MPTKQNLPEHIAVWFGSPGTWTIAALADYQSETYSRWFGALQVPLIGPERQVRNWARRELGYRVKVTRDPDGVPGHDWIRGIYGITRA